MIQLPLIGSFGGGVGLYAMREEYSLTREAFLKMWDLLEDDGVISITSWMDYPFRNSLKITATPAETLKMPASVNIDSHLAASAQLGNYYFSFKKISMVSMRIRQRYESFVTTIFLILYCSRD